MLEARDSLLRTGRHLEIGYDKALSLIKHLEPQVVAFGPDAIVAVLRSGAIPALMLSQRIEKPVHFCACNRGDAQAHMLRPTDLVDKRVVVVDDFSSTGASLQKVRRLLVAQGAEVKTFALFYDANLADRPDIGHMAEHFIQFVWERLEATPSSHVLLAEKGNRYTPDEVEEFHGYDCDGLLSINQERLVVPQGAVLISAEPKQAYATLRKRVDVAGLRHAELHCRDPQAYGISFDETIRYKADAMRHLGVSKYYESDLEQAVRIASQRPVVDVIWWSAARQLRISVDALPEPAAK